MRIPFAIVVIALVASVGSSTAAFSQSFTDDPLTVGTPVKAVHISELRLAVAHLRAFKGLPAVTFSDSTLTQTVSRILAVHVTELRSALNDVFDAAATAHPNYTDASLTGVSIKVVHIQQLRAAAVAIGSVIGACGSGGGPMTNGATACGTVSTAGETDEWTFSANAGDRIGVHVGETADADDFRPWIRLRVLNGASLGDTAGLDAAAITGALAPVTGTYQVLVASFDAGFDGTGAYRLTMTHTPGPITVSPGDEGGPLTNGALHTGGILQGDLDVWTFTANIGDRITVHVGEVSDFNDFRPWIRLWAPNGANLSDTAGLDASAIDSAVAPVTGTYLVLVASSGGFNGEGTYRLTMTHTPGPITVSGGDQGGPLINGAAHAGEILQGDLDVWTITVVAGQLITVTVGQTSETDDFRPWIRLWAPNGATLGSAAGASTAQIVGVTAPMTGTYLVLVASFDSGFDGTGTYQLTVTVP